MARTTGSHELPNLLTVTDVAEHLGVNVRHVRRLVAERRIPFIKWGHLLRFDPDEIVDWLEHNRRKIESHDRAGGTTLGLIQVVTRWLTIRVPLGARRSLGLDDSTHLEATRMTSTTPIRIGAPPSVGTMAGALLGRGRRTASARPTRSPRRATPSGGSRPPRPT